MILLKYPLAFSLGPAQKTHNSQSPRPNNALLGWSGCRPKISNPLRDQRRNKTPKRPVWNVSDLGTVTQCRLFYPCFSQPSFWMDGCLVEKKQHFFSRRVDSKLHVNPDTRYYYHPRKTNMSMENHYENNRTRDTSSFMIFFASHVSFPGVMLLMVQKSG